MSKHPAPFQLRAARQRCRDSRSLLQFVRKISGINKPSKANEAAFLAAVEAITAASGSLLATLETNAPPKDRAQEAAKARARNARRFAN